MTVELYLNLKQMHSQVLTVSRVLSTAVTWVSQKRRECALRRWGNCFSLPRLQNKQFAPWALFSISVFVVLLPDLSHTQKKRDRARERNFCSGFVPCSLYFGGGPWVITLRPLLWKLNEETCWIPSTLFVQNLHPHHIIQVNWYFGRISTIYSGLVFCSHKPWLIIIYWYCKEAKPDWNGQRRYWTLFEISISVLVFKNPNI